MIISMIIGAIIGVTISTIITVSIIRCLVHLVIAKYVVRSYHKIDVGGEGSGEGVMSLFFTAIIVITTIIVTANIIITIIIIIFVVIIIAVRWRKRTRRVCSSPPCLGLFGTPLPHPTRQHCP